MIPFNFEYYKAHSISEAIEIFQKLYKDKKEPIYYNGGTEIITFARKNSLKTKGVIDIKGIPQCNIISNEKDKIIIGASLTLTNIANNTIFPLLSKTSRGVADLTVRNKVTLGGNICGKIVYKEAILPLMLSNSNITIASKEGIRLESINKNFTNKINIDKEEFIVNFEIDKTYINLPNTSKKITKIGNVNYPLVTIAALKKGDEIRVAFSGLTNFPFCSSEVNKNLSNKELSKDKRIKNAIKAIPYKITSDIEGSSEYKKFVVANTLMDILNELEGVM
ncbi:xanthine dehydrogenase [Clostridium niameyense]|uniref:Xanthine dehydrogenase n=1 Tax=Clostridium niameyense TaxID=1622073 RepID=A0A6M0R908_9CLOT|nr:FAD binding domain-containing protein [Clostridium niameyense]NEZ46744.1 xanthine dehydrogenase [Clostridium niameyense]